MKIKFKKTAIIVSLISLAWPAVIVYRQSEAISLYGHNVFDIQLPILIVVALIAAVVSFISGVWLLIKVIRNQPHSAINIIIIVLVALLLLIAPWADWGIRLPLEKINQVVG